MAYSVSKTGQGAFGVLVADDGTTFVRRGEEGVGIVLPYDTAQAAYDTYRPRIDDDHTAWNICYALEGVIDGSVNPATFEG